MDGQDEFDGEVLTVSLYYVIAIGISLDAVLLDLNFPVYQMYKFLPRPP